jgi:hypothetical protein
MPVKSFFIRYLLFFILLKSRHAWEPIKDQGPFLVCSHKIRGYVVGLLGSKRKETIRKILLISKPVKEKIAFPNCPHFAAQIAFFGLK